MDIQQLHLSGAFVAAKPVKRSFTVTRPVTVPFDQWSDPKTPEFTGEEEEASYDVWVKRMSSADEIAILKAKEEDRFAVKVLRLALKADGTPVFESLEQVQTVEGWLFWPLFNALKGGTEEAPKQNSATTIPSGSNSPDGLEAAPRRNGKKPSPQSGETS